MHNLYKLTVSHGGKTAISIDEQLTLFSNLRLCMWFM